jgi:D-methionine transport system substrate-binding protein
MNKRKITALLLILGLALAVLTGCGGSQTPPADQGSQQNGEAGSEPVKLIIGATPEPHAEILLKAKELLQEKGIELDIREFTDYTTPNIALNDGSLDANFFQHVPYLDEFKEQNNMDLTWTTAVHFEPLGLYSHKINDLSELKDGDRIAVPNDTTNEARALWLLQDNGIITLKEGVGLTATVTDITEYHVQVQILELEAPQLPRALEDATAAVINGNYAIGAGLNPAKDAIVMEDPTSMAADTFKNVIAVRVGDENRPEILALDEVLTSPEMKQFLEEKYQGAVVPVF